MEDNKNENENELLEQPEEKEENEKIEQITKEPEKPLKIKDPKRIEAGKKLATYNRKAKKLMKENEKESQEEPSTSASWIPEINITLVVAIIGLGFTACDLFLRYKESIKITKIVPSRKIKEPEEPKESTNRKCGME